MTQSYAPEYLELSAFRGFPFVQSGDNLPDLILDSARENLVALGHHDILVVAQKVVSKAEGRQRLLDEVSPSTDAKRYAQTTGKDPRLVELILQESVSVLREADNLLITENRLGLVMANAGIDQSNVEKNQALLLPVDPDASAAAVRNRVKEHCGSEIGVVIADSIGRAWRNGTVGHAIGVAGIKALLDLRGSADLHGRELVSSVVAIADEIAAAGSLLMGQGAEGRPIVLIRGFGHIDGSSGAGELLRRRGIDLFR